MKRPKQISSHRSAKGKPNQSAVNLCSHCCLGTAVSIHNGPASGTKAFYPLGFCSDPPSEESKANALFFTVNFQFCPLLTSFRKGLFPFFNLNTNIYFKITSSKGQSGISCFPHFKANQSCTPKRVVKIVNFTL